MTHTWGVEVGKVELYVAFYCVILSFDLIDRFRFHMAQWLSG